jgi:hypothetical protein
LPGEIHIAEYVAETYINILIKGADRQIACHVDTPEVGCDFPVLLASVLSLGGCAR